MVVCLPLGLSVVHRFHSHISTETFCGQLRRDKECPFSGATKSGRVWRTVPESDARSVGRGIWKLSISEAERSVQKGVNVDDNHRHKTEQYSSVFILILKYYCYNNHTQKIKLCSEKSEPVGDCSKCMHAHTYTEAPVQTWIITAQPYIQSLINLQPT